MNIYLENRLNQFNINNKYITDTLSARNPQGGTRTLINFNSSNANKYVIRKIFNDNHFYNLSESIYNPYLSNASTYVPNNLNTKPRKDYDNTYAQFATFGEKLYKSSLVSSYLEPKIYSVVVPNQRGQSQEIQKGEPINDVQIGYPVQENDKNDLTVDAFLS